ncbi:MAG: J domain-containing protein [Spirochaetes bacterium]|nr:J domain-containing protein [Spirochaetota bacterium]
MNDKYLKLFGLNNDSTLNDVKKAYRKLAKLHHPDHFNSEEDKKKQEKIMAGITDAYNKILSGLINSDSTESVLKSNIDKGSVKESDYMLYKKGLGFYKIYFDSFFKIFHQREVVTVKDKIDCLNKAKFYFDRLKIEYPASQWSFDAEEKLKKIDKAIEYLG